MDVKDDDWAHDDIFENYSEEESSEYDPVDEEEYVVDPQP